MSKFDKNRFLFKTYQGKKLLETYSLSEVGIWEINGEDNNPDWGGAHHMPTIAVVEGTLNDAVDYAVNLDRFWTWGAGGSIKKLSIIPVNKNTIEEIDRLQAKKELLEAELASIRVKLGI